jgi:hypothetical protein
VLSKLVVLAVLALAAAAVADVVWPAAERGSPLKSDASADTSRPRRTSAGLEIVDNRVLRDGAEYLSAAEIENAFPPALAGSSFELAYAAEAPDGTVALAAHSFPLDAPPADAIQLWAGTELQSSFVVPRESFGGGLGFSSDGELVATVAPDAGLVTLYDRRGRRIDAVSFTSW